MVTTPTAGQTTPDTPTYDIPHAIGPSSFIICTMLLCSALYRQKQQICVSVGLTSKLLFALCDLSEFQSNIKMAFGYPKYTTVH